MENRHPRIALIHEIIRKIVRTKNSLLFLERCLLNNVHPKFTQYSRSFLNKVNWSPQVIEEKRKNQTEKAIIDNQNKISLLYSKLVTLI